MKVLKSRAALQEFRAGLNGSVGFVPTMGALHKGHLSLIESSIKENNYTIVSIFVNPTQFGANEDFGSYPRTLEQDIALCEKAGVSAVFAPRVEEMYFDDEVSLSPPKNMGYILEGFDRPTHFAGVLRVVLKLFMLTRAHCAYFGQKDAQQVLILQKMVRDLFVPVEIVPCPIMRDSDSLALSSRNIYLSPEQRQSALCIPRTIEAIKNEVEKGQAEAKHLRALALEGLKSVDRIFYADFFDRELKPIERVERVRVFFLLPLKLAQHVSLIIYGYKREFKGRK